MRKILPVFCFLFFLSYGSSAQSTIHQEGFEGPDYVGYSTSVPFQVFNTGSDFFLRGDGSTLPTNSPPFWPGISNYEGSNHLLWEDPDGYVGEITITLDPVSVAGYSNLNVSLGIAAPKTCCFYDAVDYLIVEYNLDNGGWVKIGECRGDASTSGYFRHDDNQDGTTIGQGETLLTSTMQYFSYPLGVTGSSIQVRVRSFSGIQEEMAIDDIQILGDLTGAAPSITANPSPQTTCESVATTFSVSATDATGYAWEESTDGGSNYSPISNGGAYSGNGTAMLTVTPTLAMDGNLYRCVVSGSLLPNATSTGALLTVNLDDASFSYAASAYCTNASDPMPTITGLSGGTFSSTPSGLILDSGSGLIDLSASMSGMTYMVTYTTAGSCPNVSSTSVAIDPVDDAMFSYSSPTYNTNGVDPLPTITGVSGGIFSSTPGGLSIDPSSGLIDLDLSSPDTYTVTYTTVGTCPGSFDVMVTIYPAPIMSGASGCTDYLVASVAGSTWVDFTDGSGNIVASINPNGNDLGTVTVQADDLGAVLQDFGGRYFIPRYFNFESSNYTSGIATAFSNGSVTVRIYIKNEELLAYNMAKGSSETFNDLNITHYAGQNEDCNLSNNAELGRVLDFFMPSVAVAYNGMEGFYLEFSLSHFSEVGVSGAVDGALPLELLSFEGRTLGTMHELTWSTAGEIDFDRFEIERSTNGIDFRMIGDVRGKGSMDTNEAYGFYDETPLFGDNYYRLKLVNEDESFAYSDLILIRSSRNSAITLLSNPVENTLGIQSPELMEANTEFTVYNSNGIKVKQHIVEQESNTIWLEMGELPAGAYFIQIRDQRKMEAYKFLKL